MAASKDFKKKLYIMLKRISIEQEFLQIKRTRLVRIEKNIAKIIDFGYLSDGLRFSVAFQPLFVPCSGVSLACGIEIERNPLMRKEFGRWSKNEENIDRDISDIGNAILTEALPFLDSIQDVDGMIRYLKSQKNSYFEPLQNGTESLVKILPYSRRFEWLGYAYLFKKEYDLAQNSFKVSHEQFSKSLPYTEDIVSSLEYILLLLNNEEYSKLENLLQDIMLNSQNVFSKEQK